MLSLVMFGQNNLVHVISGYLRFGQVKFG